MRSISARNMDTFQGVTEGWQSNVIYPCSIIQPITTRWKRWTLTTALPSRSSARLNPPTGRKPNRRSNFVARFGRICIKILKSAHCVGLHEIGQAKRWRGWRSEWGMNSEWPDNFIWSHSEAFHTNSTISGHSECLRWTKSVLSLSWIRGWTQERKSQTTTDSWTPFSNGWTLP